MGHQYPKDVLGNEIMFEVRAKLVSQYIEEKGEMEYGFFINCGTQVYKNYGNDHEKVLEEGLEKLKKLISAK